MVGAPAGTIDRMNRERRYLLIGILFIVAAVLYAFADENSLMAAFIALAVVFFALSKRG